MKEAITLYDNEHGTLQFHYSIPLSPIQQQLLFNYLVLEGFINLPEQPPGGDDYQLHFEG